MRNLRIMNLLWERDESQRQLSRRIGLHYSTLNMIIAGRLVPRESEKIRIAGGLGVEVKELFGNNCGACDEQNGEVVDA